MQTRAPAEAAYIGGGHARGEWRIPAANAASPAATAWQQSSPVARFSGQGQRVSRSVADFTVTLTRSGRLPALTLPCQPVSVAFASVTAPLREHGPPFLEGFPRGRRPQGLLVPSAHARRHSSCREHAGQSHNGCRQELRRKRNMQRATGCARKTSSPMPPAACSMESAPPGSCGFRNPCMGA